MYKRMESYNNSTQIYSHLILLMNRESDQMLLVFVFSNFSKQMFKIKNRTASSYENF